nr:HAMP domain-containing sensor histidine kinase [Catellatospora sp. TT07R-123]
MRRPSLRTKVTGGFAVGALLVSAAVGVGSYQLTRWFLLAQREDGAVRTAMVDVGIVQAAVDGDDPGVLQVLRSLDTGGNRRVLIRRDGRFYSRTVDAGLTASIPAGLVTLAEHGHGGVQLTRIGGRTALVVAVPAGPAITLYEIDFTQDLDRSLQVLALILTLVATATTGAGALLGWYAARRVLRPLATVADAAREIAAGDFTARLDPDTEPELARLTASFNQMVEQLAQRVERDRRFAADVSHELRSPLQTIAAAASVLHNRRSALDERTATAVGLLTDEVGRFQALVTDLLELARGDQPPDLAPVDMGALARQVCRARGLPADLVAVEPGAQTHWQVDRRRFTQVLANLLDNALAHGGGAVALRIVHQREARVLEVDDAGPGVCPADRDTIFGRFVRGRSAGARGGSDGTGLGLALVAQHVAAHGGRVSVHERPGGGARFRVELPGEQR